jgi:CRISPR system Cascade subunit CasB
MNEPQAVPLGDEQAPPRQQGASRDTTEHRPRLGEVGNLVHSRIARLAASRATSGTAADLARLRRSVAKPPGWDPDLWELTLSGVPGRAVSDSPTAEERAVHTALVLYAVHQQSRPEPMHVRGPGLGKAVRSLAAATQAESAVRRRFDAAATATTFEEVVHHMRGLITQLRAHRVPLDYGQLADDLHQLQDPWKVDAVRLRWGRQYYRIDRDGVSGAPAGTTDQGPDVAADHARKDAS